MFAFLEIDEKPQSDVSLRALILCILILTRITIKARVKGTLRVENRREGRVV